MMETYLDASSFVSTSMKVHNISLLQNVWPDLTRVWWPSSKMWSIYSTSAFTPTCYGLIICCVLITLFQYTSGWHTFLCSTVTHWAALQIIWSPVFICHICIANERSLFDMVRKTADREELSGLCLKTVRGPCMILEMIFCFCRFFHLHQKSSLKCRYLPQGSLAVPFSLNWSDLHLNYPIFVTNPTFLENPSLKYCLSASFQSFWESLLSQ